jgi:hypothetical protein
MFCGTPKVCGKRRSLCFSTDQTAVTLLDVAVVASW